MTQKTRNATISSLTGSSQELAPVRNQRDSIIVTNTGTSNITIGKGDVPVVANAGIVLTPNGIWSDTTDAGRECWQGAIQVIGTAGQSVAIAETTRDGVSKAALEGY